LEIAGHQGNADRRAHIGRSSIEQFRRSDPTVPEACSRRIARDNSFRKSRPKKIWEWLAFVLGSSFASSMESDVLGGDLYAMGVPWGTAELPRLNPPLFSVRPSLVAYGVLHATHSMENSPRKFKTLNSNHAKTTN
jgi:hypothetical protein